MTHPYQYSSSTVPSRVVAVNVLSEMGVTFEGFDGDPEEILAEVRPLARPAPVENLEMFLATAETEKWRYHAEFAESREWFARQFPMSILLNIPDDVSAIDRLASRMRIGSLPPVVEARRLSGRWAKRGQPFVTTRRFIARMSQEFPSQSRVFTDLIREFERLDDGYVNASRRQRISEILNDFADILEEHLDSGEAAA